MEGSTVFRVEPVARIAAMVYVCLQCHGGRILRKRVPSPRHARRREARMRGPFRLPVLIPAGLSLLFLAAPAAACPAPAPTFPPILDRWNTDCDAFGKAL